MFNPYLWLLGLGHLVVDLGQGVLPIITPILALNLDLSFFQVGTIALAFTFSSAIIQPLFGIISDSHNMPWLMPVGLFLSGFGLALTGTVNSYALLLLVVLLSGLGVAGFHPEGSKLAHFVSEEGKAGASMSIFSVGGNIGYGLGPLFALFLLGFAGLDSIYGVIVPGAIVALIYLILMPRFKEILTEKLPAHQKKQKSIEQGINKKGSLLLLILFVTTRSWIHSGLIYFIPFYFPSFKGIAEPEYLVSIYLIAGAVGTIIGGSFADRYGSRAGLLVSMAISLVVVYPFIYSNFMPSVLAFVLGGALISTFSTTVVFGQKLLPNNIGLASGLMLGFAVGMGSIGVTLLGLIADYAGLPVAMRIISVLPILGLVLGLVLPDDKGKQIKAKTDLSLEQ